MNWDDMRIFLAVARQGSLSAAARLLRVSQPTVGRRLKTLERQLATRLFDRRPDGFVPTAAGAELLPLAEAMEQSADAVSRKQASLADGISGTVRISIYEIMAQFLTDHLTALKARLPEVEIELSVAHISANLSRREADLLLRECLPDTPSLIARRLGSFAYAVYGARDYVKQCPGARTESRYTDCLWAGFDDDHSYFTGQAWLLKQRGNRPPETRMNNGIVLHDAVGKGAGLGVLPCFAADQDRRLVRLTGPLPDVQSTHHLIVHNDLRRQPSVRAVMDALIELFQVHEDSLLGRTQHSRAAA